MSPSTPLPFERLSGIEERRRAALRRREIFESKRQTSTWTALASLHSARRLGSLIPDRPSSFAVQERVGGQDFGDREEDRTWDASFDCRDSADVIREWLDSPRAGGGSEGTRARSSVGLEEFEKLRAEMKNQETEILLLKDEKEHLQQEVQRLVQERETLLRDHEERQHEIKEKLHEQQRQIQHLQKLHRQQNSSVNNNSTSPSREGEHEVREKDTSGSEVVCEHLRAEQPPVPPPRPSWLTEGSEGQFSLRLNKEMATMGAAAAAAAVSDGSSSSSSSSSSSVVGCVRNAVLIPLEVLKIGRKRGMGVVREDHVVHGDDGECVVLSVLFSPLVRVQY
jgi:hypothetical protein